MDKQNQLKTGLSWRPAKIFHGDQQRSFVATRKDFLWEPAKIFRGNKQRSFVVPSKDLSWRPVKIFHGDQQRFFCGNQQRYFVATSKDLSWWPAKIFSGDQQKSFLVKIPMKTWDYDSSGIWLVRSQSEINHPHSLVKLSQAGGGRSRGWVFCCEIKTLTNNWFPVWSWGSGDS